MKIALKGTPITGEEAIQWAREVLHDSFLQIENKTIKEEDETHTVYPAYYFHAVGRNRYDGTQQRVKLRLCEFHTKSYVCQGDLLRSKDPQNSIELLRFLQACCVLEAPEAPAMMLTYEWDKKIVPAILGAEVLDDLKSICSKPLCGAFDLETFDIGNRGEDFFEYVRFLLFPYFNVKAYPSNRSDSVSQYLTVKGYCRCSQLDDHQCFRNLRISDHPSKNGVPTANLSYGAEESNEAQALMFLHRVCELMPFAAPPLVDIWKSTVKPIILGAERISDTQAKKPRFTEEQLLAKNVGGGTKHILSPFKKAQTADEIQKTLLQSNRPTSSPVHVTVQNSREHEHTKKGYDPRLLEEYKAAYDAGTLKSIDKDAERFGLTYNEVRKLRIKLGLVGTHKQPACRDPKVAEAYEAYKIMCEAGTLGKVKDDAEKLGVPLWRLNNWRKKFGAMGTTAHPYSEKAPTKEFLAYQEAATAGTLGTYREDSKRFGVPTWKLVAWKRKLGMLPKVLHRTSISRRSLPESRDIPVNYDDLCAEIESTQEWLNKLTEARDKMKKETARQRLIEAAKELDSLGINPGDLLAKKPSDKEGTSHA
jgi:hypothetical protein